MRVDVLTLFPGLFEAFKRETLIKGALQKGLLDLQIYNLRAWARGRHQQVDDYPFGGGPGMVLKPEPIFRAMDDLLKGLSRKPTTIFFTPSGDRLTQERLKQLSGEEHLIFICGRYKGVDQRVLDELVDLEISIGDYVLSGGELPAMVVLEGVTRLIPGAIGDIESARTDSLEDDLLEGPLYTRPEEFRGMRVPQVLLSGHHAKISDWRLQQALEKTRLRRPDLWKKYLEKVRKHQA